MILLIALFLVAFVSWFFLLVNDPLIISFFLITCSMLVRLFIAVKLRVLLSILIFLTYVGGIMVLFLYILSVCPNQKLVRLNLWLKLLLVFVIRISFVFLSSSLRGYDDKSISSIFHVMCFIGKRDLYVFFSIMLLYVIILVCYFCSKKRVSLRKSGEVN